MCSRSASRKTASPLAASGRLGPSQHLAGLALGPDESRRGKVPVPQRWREAARACPAGDCAVSGWTLQPEEPQHVPRLHGPRGQRCSETGAQAGAGVHADRRAGDHKSQAGGLLAGVEGNERHHGTVAGQPGTQPDSWLGQRDQAHGVSGSFQQVLVHAQDSGRDPHLVSLSEGCPLVWSTTCI